MVGSMSNNRLTQFMVEHPRLTSALLTATLLLSQVGGVLANGKGSTGP